MAILDSILTRVLGKRPDFSELDKVLAELKEAQRRNAEASAGLIAACRADRAASIRLRRQIRATNRRMRAELEADRAS